MADYVLSRKADDDLTDIYLFSYQTFGEQQADAYFLGLRDCLQALAGNPSQGRSAAHLLPGLLVHRHKRHFVFYMRETGGIFVVRIHHDAMDFGRHIGSTDKHGI
ncbi:MAG: type II toxin-antitoxin system RelE/ParE family toxin [Alphaproteobacteria bacterium]|nr:type II toxin-antitoxin system RelE/ParE family toxin [Alphaproteobacteria bacterium]